MPYLTPCYKFSSHDTLLCDVIIWCQTPSSDAVTWCLYTTLLLDIITWRLCINCDIVWCYNVTAYAMLLCDAIMSGHRAMPLCDAMVWQYHVLLPLKLQCYVMSAQPVYGVQFCNTVAWRFCVTILHNIVWWCYCNGVTWRYHLCNVS